jgi:cytochrome c oxidase assembly protein subunit 11
MNLRMPLRNALLASTLVAVVAGMVGLAFASVPLYRLFCQITGYQGTTQRAEANLGQIGSREVVVRFDANVSGLSWRFYPEVQQVHVKVGETAMVNFVAENTGASTTIGTATYNVQPDAAGAYFNKIQCFCFTKQTLKAGERLEMPVQFFVSPDVDEERDLRATRIITLSYTFFPATPAGQPVAQADGDGSGKSM